MSPQPGSESPPRFSNETGIQSPEHPDAPLPIEPYHDDPLAEYEPRPITADEYEGYEAVRPRSKWATFWLRNKGMFLVLLAQMFGASMNVMTKVLEMYSSMHPFQVSFCIRLESWGGFDRAGRYTLYGTDTWNRSSSLACPSLL